MVSIAPEGIYVLCPVCKVGAVKKTLSVASFPMLACVCGFSFQTTQEPLHGALEDFQELIVAALMAHRCGACSCQFAPVRL